MGEATQEAFELVTDDTPMPVMQRGEKSDETNAVIEHVAAVTKQYPGEARLVATGDAKKMSSLQGRLGSARKNRSLLPDVKLRVRELPPSHRNAPGWGLWAQLVLGDEPFVDDVDSVDERR